MRFSFFSSTAATFFKAVAKPATKPPTTDKNMWLKLLHRVGGTLAERMAAPLMLGAWLGRAHGGKQTTDDTSLYRNDIRNLVQETT